MPVQIEAHELTDAHVGRGIIFGIDTGLTITDVSPGYLREGNVKIGLFGRHFGHAVTEVQSGTIVTLTERN